MRPASVPLIGLRALGLAAGMLALGACSTMEKLDPTTWFEEPPATTVSTPAKPRPGAEGVPGQGQAFPNLGSVPGQAPKPQTTAGEREKIADALVADTQGVQYADKVAKPEQAAIASPSPRPQKAEAAKPSDTASAPAGQARPAPAAAEKPAQPSSQAATQPPTPLAPTTPPAPATPIAAAPSPPSPVTPSAKTAPGPPAPQPVGPPVAVVPPAPVARAPTLEPTGPIPQPPAPPEGIVPTTTIAGAGAPAPPRQRSAGAKEVRSLDQFNRSRVAVSAEVGTISFAGGESDLRAADLAVLRELASAHRARGGLVRVVGYARGPASAERAMQVAHALVERGVPASKIYAGEMGMSDPAYNEPRSEMEPDNRRVEIFFDY
jgi:outer membrane protein OmpA-like peptidoglycan-associated protein